MRQTSLSIADNASSSSLTSSSYSVDEACRPFQVRTSTLQPQNHFLDPLHVPPNLNEFGYQWLAPEVFGPGRLCCPYRRRNPARFNIRNFPNCATNGFGDLAALKRHIRTYHRRSPGPNTQYAQRLKELPTLLSNDVARADDPEDGIDEQIEHILAERKHNRKISSWQELWRVLFTDEEIIPSSVFIPPKIVEVPEVYSALRNVPFDERSVMSMIPRDGNAYSSKGLSNYVTTALMTELEHISGNDITLQPSFEMPNSPRSVGSSSGATYSPETGEMGQGVGSFKCPLCLRHYTPARDLSRHVATVHPTGNHTNYSCRCGKLHVRKDNFLRHCYTCRRTSLSNGMFECRCGYASPSVDETRQHVKACNQTRAGRPPSKKGGTLSL